jgi:S-formylglutathione hydrolase FrmB
VSIVAGPFPAFVVALALALLLAGVDWRARQWRRHLARSTIAAVTVTGLLVLGQTRFGLVPYGFPVRYYVWVGVVALALCSCLFARRLGRWRRAAALVAVPLTAVAALVLVNADYQYYPSLRSLFGVDAQDQVSLARLQQQRFSAPGTETPPVRTMAQVKRARRPRAATGEVVQVRIPGTVSHFRARSAWVWVPPAYVSGRIDSAPVVMLLAGTPGRPSDWIRSGGADRIADRYAAQHDGLAPIVVMPDINGSFTADSECVGRDGAVETYLTVDVPAYMGRHFGAPAHRGFAVAGLSEGGTCATALALRHPDLFVAFADYSGLTSPTPTERVNPRVAARVLFGGSMAAYRAHDPLTLLRTGHYPSLAGYFVAGSSDHQTMRAQATLVPLARAAGLSVSVRTIHGGHDWQLWGKAFADTFGELGRSFAAQSYGVASAGTHSASTGGTDT